MFTNSEVISAGKLNYTATELNYTKAFNFNGHTYQLYITNDYNWNQINAFCEYKGGHLVTITSKEEQKEIYNQTSSYYGMIEKVEWSSLAIGLYKETNSWKWVTGEPYSYSCWQSEQPNTSNGQYRGYFTITKNGNWHDYGAVNDSNIGNFICGFILEYDKIVECEEFSYAKKLDYAGRTYFLYVFDHTKVYSQVKEFSANNGGHLLTITSSAENKAVYNAFRNYANIITKKGVYMDATDSKSEGKWKWNTGETWSYTNWQTSQPDDAFDGTEDYLVFDLKQGDWNDIRPTIEYSMIILEVDC